MKILAITVGRKNGNGEILAVVVPYYSFILNE